MPFLLCFIGIPFIEFMVFAEIGDEIGFFNAFAVTCLTAIIGAALVRHQGLKTFLAFQESARQGNVPLDHIFDGFCLMIAGVFLIIPGFVTDAIGFLLLLPPVRNILRHILRNQKYWQVVQASTTTTQNTKYYTHKDPAVLEGEYEDISPPDKE